MESNKQRILGVPFDFIDFRALADQIDRWRQRDHARYITFTNPHVVMLAAKDPDLNAALQGASLVLPDGVGVVLASRILGFSNAHRVTGPSAMLQLCQYGLSKNYRHYFYGGTPHVVRNLAQRLRQSFPGIQIVGICSPPFHSLTDEQEQNYLRSICDASPDIVWVGLGAPKQEKWMKTHCGSINCAVMLGVGAAFDFNSGEVKRAPTFMRKFGLEWLYRLCENPKRMWRRNLDSPKFVFKVLLQRLAG